MDRISTLQSKLKELWSGISFCDVYQSVASLSSCEADSFVMIFSIDYDPGYSYHRDGYSFDSAHEALAFLRYAVIPSILTDDQDAILSDVEAYFDDYQLDEIVDLKLIVELIDVNFNKDIIIKDDMEIIRAKFNEIFEHQFVAEIEIHAWGSVADVMKSDYIDGLISSY